jgi:hypothetical protein
LRRQRLEAVRRAYAGADSSYRDETEAWAAIDDDGADA